MKIVIAGNSMVRLFIGGLLLLLGVCILVPAFSQETGTKSVSVLDKQEAHKRLRELVSEQLRKENVNGLSVSVVHDQETWFSSGFGLADAENKISVSSETQFRLGAISSVFTAILVLKLEQDGLLNVNDPLSKYFPKLSFKSRDNANYEITIKQLLTHHSGLPLSILKNSWAENPPDFRDMFNGDQEIYFSQAPDTIYTYSNLGYSLLGLLIEKVTNKTYEEVLNDFLLEPLQMNSTGISKPDANPVLLSRGYKKANVKKMLYPRDLPSLGMYSSVTDMDRFIKHINRVLSGAPGVLSIDSMRNMLKIQNIHVALDLGNKIGMGWMITGTGIDGTGPLAWRAGASLYHRTRMAFLPQKKIAVVVMANDSTAWDVVEKVSETALELAVESIYGLKRADTVDKQPRSREAYGTNDNFANSYSSFLGYIPVTNRGKTIQTELLGWPVIANQDGHGWYDLQYDLFGFIPIDLSWITDIKVKPARIESKRVIIVLYKETQHLFASELMLHKPTLIWQRRVGKYEVDNPDALTEIMEIREGELVYEFDQLFFKYKLPMFIGLQLKIPLQVINDEMAIIPGLGTALNEIVTVRNIDGKELLEFSGYLLAKKNKKVFFN